MVVIFCTLLTAAPRSGEGFAICLSLTWGWGGGFANPLSFTQRCGVGEGEEALPSLGALLGRGRGGGLCLFPWG